MPIVVVALGLPGFDQRYFADRGRFLLCPVIRIFRFGVVEFITGDSALALHPLDALFLADPEVFE